MDNSERAEKDLEDAMKEPIFTEFVDQCLEIVEPSAQRQMETWWVEFVRDLWKGVGQKVKKNCGIDIGMLMLWTTCKYVGTSKVLSQGVLSQGVVENSTHKWDSSCALCNDMLE